MNSTILYNLNIRSKNFIFLGLLIGTGLILRAVYFPDELPVNCRRKELFSLRIRHSSTRSFTKFLDAS